MRVAPTITLPVEQRRTLELWSRGRTIPARLVTRAKVILLAADGSENIDIAREVGIDRGAVGRWRTRFATDGLAGIKNNRPGRSRKLVKRQALADEIVGKATPEKPASATHWSTRTLGAALGINPTMVHRVWKDAGLKPHLTKTFKLSNDP